METFGNITSPIFEVSEEIIVSTIDNSRDFETNPNPEDFITDDLGW
jgi:hypothetical protein